MLSFVVHRQGPRRILLGALLASAAACEPTNQGYAPEQPIQYSHAVHAGTLQIPCQYCHFAAEVSRHAGIPPASVCMNCHRQVLPEHPEILKVKAALDTATPIAWERVNFMPDHVYFDHRAHIGASIACQECHGPVESMGRVEQWAPLTMGFCLDCHRQRGAGVTAASGPQQAGPLTDCAACHH